jgi:hypothetical protein
MKPQTTQTSSKTNLNHNEIATRAYQIWENAGRPTCSEMKHWLQAEEELTAPQKLQIGQASPKPMQKATGETAEHAAAETIKAQPHRQASGREQSRGT